LDVRVEIGRRDSDSSREHALVQATIPDSNHEVRIVEG
jgi:hypothetical protein